MPNDVNVFVLIQDYFQWRQIRHNIGELSRRPDKNLTPVENAVLLQSLRAAASFMHKRISNNVATGDPKKEEIPNKNNS